MPKTNNNNNTVLYLVGRRGPSAPWAQVFQHSTSTEKRWNSCVPVVSVSGRRISAEMRNSALDLRFPRRYFAAGARPTDCLRLPPLPTNTSRRSNSARPVTPCYHASPSSRCPWPWSRPSWPSVCWRPLTTTTSSLPPSWPVPLFDRNCPTARRTWQVDKSRFWNFEEKSKNNLGSISETAQSDRHLITKISKPYATPKPDALLNFCVNSL